MIISHQLSVYKSGRMFRSGMNLIWAVNVSWYVLPE